MSEPESGKTRIELDGKKMTVMTSHQIYGVAKEELEVEYNGSPITIACNYKALADFLKVAGGRKIEFVVNSQGSPMLLKILNDDNYIYISMPLKLHE